MKKTKKMIKFYVSVGENIYDSENYNIGGTLKICIITQGQLILHLLIKADTL